eukprot:SAG31_NODE_930_length_10920_cov_4.478329_7_plen_116_part_00
MTALKKTAVINTSRRMMKLGGAIQIPPGLQILMVTTQATQTYQCLRDSELICSKRSASQCVLAVFILKLVGVNINALAQAHDKEQRRNSIAEKSKATIHDVFLRFARAGNGTRRI